MGAAICRSLASSGAVVAIGYARNRDRTEALLRDLQEGGAGGSIHRGNVSSPEDCRRTVAEVVDQHGHIDILVNNAGIVSPKSVLRMAADEWRKVIEVNLSGTFYMSQSGLSHMVEQGSGRIINISSIVGETGLVGHANYAASKSGLYGLTKTLAREAAFQLDRAGKLNDATRNITVNTVEPWVHRDRNARDGRRGVPGRHSPSGAATATWAPGGDRAGRAVSLRGRLVLYHGTGVVGEWWIGHVNQTQARAPRRPAGRDR
jgi:NAD(P)-dependent dehydrogenase (short-subunit alcohol dehydrogenase family)